MDMVASVAIMSGKLSTLAINPLSRPIRPPTASAMIKTAHTGSTPKELRRYISAIVNNAFMPTEISMPPVEITKVIPIAIMPNRLH